MVHMAHTGTYLTLHLVVGGPQNFYAMVYMAHTGTYLTLHLVVGGPTEFLRHGTHGPHGYHLHDHAGDGGAGHGGHEAAQGQVHLHPAAGGARVLGCPGVVRRLQHPPLPGVRDAAHHRAGNNNNGNL